MPSHKPVVWLNTPDNRLSQPGFTRRWYPNEPGLWQESAGENVWIWHGKKDRRSGLLTSTQLVTLQPKYELDPTEAQLDQWTQGGNNVSYVEVSGIFGSSGKAILQQNPSATACTLTSTFDPEDNQPCFVDLYLLEVYDDAWSAVLQFCDRYRLLFQYNGSIQLWRNIAVGAEEDFWKYVDSGPTVNNIFNQHLRLSIYPSNEQLLHITALDFEPIMYIDDEPTISEDGTYTIRTICPTSKVTLTVSSGAFYFGYRFMKFETDGFLTLPLQSLKEEYGGEYSLSFGVGKPRTGHAFAVTETIVDAAGDTITNPPASPFRDYAPKLTFTGADGEMSPEIYWMQFNIDPTTEVHAPGATQITAGGRLLSLDVNAAKRGNRTSRVNLYNLDGAVEGLGNTLRMAANISEGGETVWSGYLKNRELPEEQSGMSALLLDGRDTLTRLEIPLQDSYIGDGELHTGFVSRLLKRAGIAENDFVCVVSSTDLTLPQAIGAETPIFQWRDGQFIREAVEYIGKQFSGYDLWADREGVIHYESGALTASGLALLPYAVSNAATELQYFTARQFRNEESFFNVIAVVGRDIRGGAPKSVHYDVASINDSSSVNYLGYEKVLGIVDTNLRNEAQTEDALNLAVAFHGTPQLQYDVEADWHNTLDLMQSVLIGGTAFEIVSIGHKWSPAARLQLRLERT